MKRLPTLSALVVLVASTASFQPFAEPSVQNEGRQMTRVLYLPNHDPALGVNSFAIQYGTPVWREAHAAQFEKLTKGKRWRLGRDHWSTLDTNIALGVGRKKLAAGAYYLVLENAGKGKWSLVVLDPVKMRKQKMDAYGAHATRGGIVLPLEVSKGAIAKKLSIELVPGAKKPRDVTLKIRFGPYVLTGQIKAKG
jgi:Protein of unknown function (DUF2911)